MRTSTQLSQQDGQLGGWNRVRFCWEGGPALGAVGVWGLSAKPSAMDGLVGVTTTSMGRFWAQTHPNPLNWAPLSGRKMQFLVRAFAEIMATRTMARRGLRDSPDSGFLTVNGSHR